MMFLNEAPKAPGLRSPLALALGLALSQLATGSAWSQAQPVANQLVPVVVVATREPQAIDRVLADVSVISREDIERRGASAAVDLIKALPGFQSVRNGGPAATSSLYLRGAESRHVLVLIDGVRVDTQSGSGGATWELMPAAQIDHIEVVRGPASAIYGSDAAAGVIQIFTRSGQGPAHLDLGVGVGSLGFVSKDAQLSGAHEGLRYSVSVATERATGFGARSNVRAGTRAADDDGYESASASTRLGYTFNAQHQVQAALTRHHLNGQYDASTTSAADDRSIHDLNTASLQWVAQWLQAWRSTFALTQSTDRYETRPSPYVTQTEVKNASWINQVQWGAHTLHATLEGREDHLINASVTGPKDTRRDGALGLGYDWHDGPLAMQSFIREDHDSEFGQHVNGSVAGGWDLSPAWRVRTSWGTAFRAPTLFQRFSPNGQANLVPEASRTGELGLQYRQGENQFGITAYNTHFNNLLSYGAAGVCQSTQGCYRNTASAVLKGWELSGGSTWADVRLTGSVNFDGPTNQADGKLLARRARQYARLKAETDVFNWQLAVRLEASAKRFDDAANLNRLPGYAVWGVDAQTRLAPQWTLVLRADNVFDRSYQTALNYGSTPQTAFVGVRWTPGL